MLLARRRLHKTGATVSDSLRRGVTPELVLTTQPARHLQRGRDVLLSSDVPGGASSDVVDLLDADGSLLKYCVTTRGGEYCQTA